MAELIKSLGFLSLGPFITCCQLIHLRLKPALIYTLKKGPQPQIPFLTLLSSIKDKEE